MLILWLLGSLLSRHTRSADTGEEFSNLLFMKARLLYLLDEGFTPVPCKRRELKHGKANSWRSISERLWVAASRKSRPPARVQHFSATQENKCKAPQNRRDTEKNYKED